MISIIVPMYKAERYIERCVDSIRVQTLTDWRLIIVDDGSPDRCGDIADEYAAQDDRITVIHQTNQGLSSARNTGIEYVLTDTQSEWICFIDADDWVHPYYLEYLYRSVTGHKTKVGCCYYKTAVRPQEPADVAPHSVVMPWDEFYLTRRLQAVPAWGKIYHRSLFDTIRYPVGKLHEDEFTTWKLLESAGIVSVVPEVLYHYYINPDGITKSKWTPNRLDALDAFREQIECFADGSNPNLYRLAICCYCNSTLSTIDKMDAAPWISPQTRYAVRLRLRSQMWEVWVRHACRFFTPETARRWYRFIYTV